MWLFIPIGPIVALIFGIIKWASGAGKSKSENDGYDISIRQPDEKQQKQFKSEEINISTPGHETSGIRGILVMSGPMTGCKVAIADGETINLGKDQKLTHLVFTKEYGKVSRLHCTAAYSDKFKKYYVTDCSANGTYFTDGTRLAKGVRTPMQPGTTLLLADDSCKVQLL